MNRTSQTLVIQPDRPLDGLLLDILRRVDTVTADLGIQYFIGGALARDVVLFHVFGRDTGRATRDVDVGICIEEWSLLEALRGRLVESGAFALVAGVVHRLLYRPVGTELGIPLDLLPFGGVETNDHVIRWPPASDTVMSVAGFSEASDSVLMIEVAANFAVPVVSLPSLAILKLMAWHDRHLVTPKDATDLLMIARKYADAGNADRLFGAESSLLQAFDFDGELAGAQLLGKDAATLCPVSAKRAVVEILREPTLKQQLLDQALAATLVTRDDVASARVALVLQAFQDGLE